MPTYDQNIGYIWIEIFVPAAEKNVKLMKYFYKNLFCLTMYCDGYVFFKCYFIHDICKVDMHHSVDFY